MVCHANHDVLTAPLKSNQCILFRFYDFLLSNSKRSYFKFIFLVNQKIGLFFTNLMDLENVCYLKWLYIKIVITQSKSWYTFCLMQQNYLNVETEMDGEASKLVCLQNSYETIWNKTRYTQLVFLALSFYFQSKYVIVGIFFFNVQF